MKIRTQSGGISIGMLVMGILTAVLATMLITNSISAGSEKSGKHNLELESRFTFFTDITSNLPQGEHKYQESDLFEPGDAPGGPIIGSRRISQVAVHPVGTPGGLWWGFWTIDGVGEIFTTHSGEGLPTGGAVIGGTGAFRGASGVIERSDGLWKFRFDRPISD